MVKTAWRLFLLVVLLVGCAAPGASSKPTPTQSIQPATPTEPLPSPTASPSAAATPTPTPALTPGCTPVSILSFEVSPPEVRAGDPVMLTWNTNGDGVVICQYNSTQAFDPHCTSSLPPSGTVVLTAGNWIEHGYLADFWLHASRPCTITHATASTKVGCSHEWFFPNPPAGCPGEAVYGTVMAQHFEHGLMIALVTSGQDPCAHFMILYDEVGPGGYHHHRVESCWDQSMPEEDPDIIPPEGYYEPVRGFGKVWREERGVREHLGWATGKAFVVGEGAYQYRLAGKYSHPYITGPDGAVYVLPPEDSEWYIWTGPTPTPTP